MYSFSQRRLVQDLQKVRKNDDQGIVATPNADNIFKWQAYILGPVDTIWEGGTFRLQINFEDDYPNKPPKITFVSKMFHPNIYSDGNICLDILQNKWSPMYDICAVLTSIRSLLSDPNPDSPANQQAAQMFANNLKEYEKRVKQIVELSWASKLSLESMQQEQEIKE